MSNLIRDAKREGVIAQATEIIPYYVKNNNDACILSLVGSHDKVTFVLPSDRITFTRSSDQTKQVFKNV